MAYESANDDRSEEKGIVCHGDEHELSDQLTSLRWEDKKLTQNEMAIDRA
jgi:hypothetical protein